MPYGIYKACKGDSSDTKYIAVLETEKEAKQAVERMRTLQEQKKDIYLAYVDGWEFRCYWDYEEVKVESLEEFNKKVDEIIADCEDTDEQGSDWSDLQGFS